VERVIGGFGGGARQDCVALFDAVGNLITFTQTEDRTHCLRDGDLPLCGEFAGDHRISDSEEFPYGKDNPYICQDGSDDPVRSPPL
jgi:hypothetical protein